MARFLKVLGIIVGVLLLLVVGLLAFLWIKLDPEALGQEVLRRVNETEGLALEAETFEIRVLEGLRLEDARFESELESGSASGELGRVLVDYELWPILRGELVIQRIVIERPTIRVVTREAPEATDGGDESSPPSASPEPAEVEAAEAEEETGFQPTVSIGELALVDASLSIATEGDEDEALTLEGLTIRFDDFFLDPKAPDPILGLEAKGQMELDRISAGELNLGGGRGSLLVDRGRISVTGLGIETDNTSLEISELGADLTQDPAPYRLTAGGKCDLDGFVQSEEGGFGPATLELSLSGSGPELEAASGEGVLRLSAGEIPTFPMIRKIERLLGESYISGQPYQATDLRLVIADGDATLEPFELAFEGLRLAAGGDFDLGEETVDMKVVVFLPRERVDIDVLAPFIDGMTDDEGWTAVPFDVEGSIGDPDVDIDLTAAKETAVDMGKRAVGDAVGGLLDRTFGRKKKNGDDGR